MVPKIDLPDMNFSFEEEFTQNQSVPQELQFKITEEPDCSMAYMSKLPGTEEDFIYVKKLLSALIKLQNLHWAAPSNSYHVHIDEFNDIVKTYIDDIAEIIQGIYGAQFAPGCFGEVLDIKFDKCDTNIPFRDLVCTTLFSLKNDSERWWKQHEDDFNYEGARNVIADFIESINKYNYLFKIDSQE